MKYLLPWNWPIFFKILSASLIVLAVFAFIFLKLIIPFVSESLYQQKMDATRNVAEAAYSVVSKLHQDYKNSLITENQAKQSALDQLAAIRYENEDYIWVNDMRPVMLMHPVNSSLNGKDLSDYKDPEGKLIFKEMVSVVQKDGKGFVPYMWPKPGTEKPVPKISYVIRFDSWDWIIGTGVYADDLDVITGKLEKTVLQTGILFAAAMMLFSVIFAYGLSRPLRQAVRITMEIEKGNLLVPSGKGGSDEAGRLMEGLHMMKERLSEMIDKIIPLSLNIDDITTSLKTAAVITSKGTFTQSMKAQDIASTTEEMSLTIKEISRSTETVSGKARKAMLEASEGQKSAKSIVGKVDMMRGSTDALVKSMHHLKSSVNAIGNVVGTIKGIADQTNLLALNAAIEAAKSAGHGSRFAVVSEEVRKLAERTIQATEDIAQKVAAVAEETARTELMMEQSSQHVEEADKGFHEMDEILTGIINAFKEVQESLSHIASGIEEQSIASQSVAKTLEESRQSNNEIARSAENVKDLVVQLSQVAEKLRESTQGIQTKGNRLTILSLAKVDHRLFCNRVEDHLNGAINLKETDITDHYNCRLGKWYYSVGMQTVGMLRTFKDLEDPHARIHNIARDAVKHKNEGDAERAQAEFREMEKVSGIIQESLDSLREEFAAILAKESSG